MTKTQKHYLLILGFLGFALFLVMITAEILFVEIGRISSQIANLEPTEALAEGLNHGNREKLVTATCYTATGNRTFSGTWPKWGTLVIRFQSPIVGHLKMGDKVYIEEFEQVFTVEDRLPDRWTGRDIDIFVPWSDEECAEWGVNKLKMEIL